MYRESQPQIDYDREIEKIDEAILACKRDFEDLVYKRHEFIAWKFGLDVIELMDYIVKSYDDVPQEAVDIIVSKIKKKTEQLRRERR